MNVGKRWGLRAVALTATGLMGLALAAPASAAEPANDNTVMYHATLNPLNNSGGSGTATVALNDDQATVTVDYTGLATTFGGNPYPHVQHIHINGNGACPAPTADDNGDGIVDTVEGVPAYGTVGTSLTTSGPTGAAQATNITDVPSGGSANYERTFDINLDTASAIINGEAVIVVHGLNPADLSAQAQQEMSNLAPSLPLAATAPALCGALTVPNAPVTYQATLNQLNSSGASGSATVVLDQGTNLARVTLQVEGLLDGAPHAQHIHIGGMGMCPGPDAATSHNGRKAISTVDGVPAYGMVATSLTVTGDTSPASALAVARFKASGSYSYSRQITVGDDVAQSLLNGKAAIVVHGIDYNGNGKYDDVLGASELNGDLPLEATAPALCGKLIAHGTPVGNPDCISSPFDDVEVSNIFCGSISWLKDQGVSRGFVDGGFHPTAGVTRQAMAAFLYRFENSGQSAPACESKPFPDVETSNIFCGEITWLKDQSITTGFTDGGFHPTAGVTRQAMAGFVFRLEHSGGQAPACTEEPFSDVSVSNVFCGAISWLKDQHVTAGYTDGGFHPATDMSRQAYATWFARADALV